MSFWVSLVILWFATNQVQSDPIKQEDGKGLHFGDDLNNLTLVEYDPETIEELYSDETVVHEGDIMLDTNRNAVAYIWTRNIPYVIDYTISHRSDEILQAMKMISGPTCVKFHPHKDEMNYLFIEGHRGCASYVGCIGGKQPIYIGEKCKVGNIAHEFLHGLGFHHEHTRHDRDDHVKIHTKNVRQGALKNFLKQPGDTGGLPYDSQSIMHYGNFYFSKNGEPTIESNNPDEKLGQRKRLSERDIERVRVHYKCDLVENEPGEEGQTDAAPNTTPHQP